MRGLIIVAALAVIVLVLTFPRAAGDLPPKCGHEGKPACAPHGKTACSCQGSVDGWKQDPANPAGPLIKKCTQYCSKECCFCRPARPERPPSAPDEVVSR